MRWITNKWHGVNNTVRAMYVRAVCKHVGHSLFVNGGIFLRSPENISIGDHCSLNHNVTLSARGSIDIGDYVHISSNTVINSAGLDYSKSRESRGHIKKKTILENGAWIGSGSIINPGVTVGENAVVGAGSVVTKDVPANTVVVGVPARVIKEISYKE